MPIIFSPVTEEPLGPTRVLFPRSAFLICQQSEVPLADQSMIDLTRECIERMSISGIDAANFRRTGDYLSKILDQIRGSGFCIAIFSEGTREQTLANIFLEIGMAYLLGKPVVILKTAQARVPSDLVRSEYIEYTGDVNATSTTLDETINNSVLNTAEYLVDLANIAQDADDPDFELVHYRFMQAVLMNGDKSILDKLENVRVSFADRLRDDGSDSIRRKILDDMRIQNSTLKKAFEGTE